MAEKRCCEFCGEELKDIHDSAQCKEIERLNGRKTIKTLKESVNSWKDAWFQGRDIIANLWWYHPAIADDNQRAYYQAAQKRIKSNG